MCAFNMPVSPQRRMQLEERWFLQKAKTKTTSNRGNIRLLPPLVPRDHDDSSIEFDRNCDDDSLNVYWEDDDVHPENQVHVDAKHDGGAQFLESGDGFGDFEELNDSDDDASIADFEEEYLVLPRLEVDGTNIEQGEGEDYDGMNENYIPTTVVGENPIQIISDRDRILQHVVLNMQGSILTRSDKKLVLTLTNSIFGENSSNG